MGDKQRELAYLQGERAAYRQILSECLDGLGYGLDTEAANRVAWIAEREAAIAALRGLCEEFGDNEWAADVPLSDVINKHLGVHLWEDEPLLDRLQNILARYDREDTGKGFGRPQVAWAMADDLRTLIKEIREGA